MAYEVPRQWAHGDVPTAAQMNAYSNALASIKSVADRMPPNPALLKFGGDPDDAEWRITHAARWLHVPDACTLYNANDSSQTTSVPEPPSGTILAFDLNTVDWLLPGTHYIVDGVPWAFERDTF